MGFLKKLLGKSTETETIRINIKDFINEYKGYCDEELFWQLLELEFKYEYWEIPKKQYNEAVAKKDAMDKKWDALAKAAGLNNQGIALEKEGKIDEAIAVYEQNIGDVYQTHHPYERLVILYRKRKDYDNEIRVIDIALEYLCKGVVSYTEKYTKRKLKAMDLKEKQKSIALESNAN